MGLTTVTEKKNENQKFQFNFGDDAKNKIDLIKNRIKLLTHDKVRKECENIEQKKNTFIFN